MTALRRLHIWTGLFAFTALLVMAIAGLHATLRQFVDDDSVASVTQIAYRAGAARTDGEVAADLARRFQLPLPEPLPRGALRRNERHELELRLDSQNGAYLLTLFEEAGTVRVEHRRNSLGRFLTLLHARTFVGTRGPLPIHLWALYVDLGIVSLCVLIASGIGLWLASRPRLGWARALLASSVLLFASLWWMIR